MIAYNWINKGMSFKQSFSLNNNPFVAGVNYHPGNNSWSNTQANAQNLVEQHAANTQSINELVAGFSGMDREPSNYGDFIINQQFVGESPLANGVASSGNGYRFKPADMGSENFHLYMQYSLSYAHHLDKRLTVNQLFDFNNAGGNAISKPAAFSGSMWIGEKAGVKFAFYGEVQVYGLELHSNSSGRVYPFSSGSLNIGNFPSTNIYGKTEQYPYAIRLHGYYGNRRSYGGMIHFSDYNNFQSWVHTILIPPPSSYWEY
jgi:hypothetical protein